MTDKKQKIFLLLMLPFLLVLIGSSALFIANNIYSYSNYYYDTATFIINIINNSLNLISCILLGLYALVPSLRKKPFAVIGFAIIRIISMIVPQVYYMLGGGPSNVIGYLFTIVVGIIPFIFILLSTLIKNKVFRCIALVVQVVYLFIFIASAVVSLNNLSSDFSCYKPIVLASNIANIVSILAIPSVLILVCISQLFSGDIQNKKAVPAYGAPYIPAYNPAFNSAPAARPYQPAQTYPQQRPQSAPPVAPQPPVQSQADASTATLENLHRMYVNGIITEEEFNSKKAEILERI